MLGSQVFQQIDNWQQLNFHGEKSKEVIILCEEILFIYVDYPKFHRYQNIMTKYSKAKGGMKKLKPPKITQVLHHV